MDLLTRLADLTTQYSQTVRSNANTAAVETARQDCKIAREAFTQHRAEHGC
jgi:hypothetical protein